jgi:hypothetical protein
MGGEKRLTEEDWADMQGRWQRYHAHLVSSGAPVLRAAYFLNEYLKGIYEEYRHGAGSDHTQR